MMDRETKLCVGDLLPTVADVAGADLEDEVTPIIRAFVGVLGGTLAEGKSVVLTDVGTLKSVAGRYRRIEFRPSRRLLHELRRS
jgi:hypothetical protein